MMMMMMEANLLCTTDKMLHAAIKVIKCIKYHH